MPVPVILTLELLTVATAVLSMEYVIAPVLLVNGGVIKKAGSPRFLRISVKVPSVGVVLTAP